MLSYRDLPHIAAGSMPGGACARLREDVMGQKLSARTALMAMVAAFCDAMSAPAEAQPPPPCVEPAAWFPHSRTPEQNSAGFPGDPNNCDFHQWSWNAFLWLTQ